MTAIELVQEVKKYYGADEATRILRDAVLESMSQLDMAEYLVANLSEDELAEFFER